jgi:hypothetical protein
VFRACSNSRRARGALVHVQCSTAISQTKSNCVIFANGHPLHASRLPVDTWHRHLGLNSSVQQLQSLLQYCSTGLPHRQTTRLLHHYFHNSSGFCNNGGAARVPKQIDPLQVHALRSLH